MGQVPLQVLACCYLLQALPKQMTCDPTKHIPQADPVTGKYRKPSVTTGTSSTGRWKLLVQCGRDPSDPAALVRVADMKVLYF